MTTKINAAERLTAENFQPANLAVQRIERFCADIKDGIKRKDKNFVDQQFINIENVAKNAHK